MIENLLRTKSVEYCVSLKDDIIKFINHFYQTQEGEKSFSELLGSEWAAGRRPRRVSRRTACPSRTASSCSSSTGSSTTASSSGPPTSTSSPTWEGKTWRSATASTAAAPSTRRCPTATGRPSSRASRSCRTSTSRSEGSPRTARSSSSVRTTMKSSFAWPPCPRRETSRMSSCESCKKAR